MNLKVIFTGLAIAGVAATAVLTHRAALKADNEHHIAVVKKSLTNDSSTSLVSLTNKELFKVTWKCYIPPVLAGVTTVGLIIASNHFTAKAALAAGGIGTAVYENRDRIKRHAAEMSQEYQNFLAEQRAKACVGNFDTIELTGTGDMLCYLMHEGRYFRSSLENVERAIKLYNQRYIDDRGASLNTFYDFLQIKETGFGYIHGAIKYDGDNPIDDNPLDISYEINNDGVYKHQIADDYWGLCAPAIETHDEPICLIKYGFFPDAYWYEF